MFFFSAHFVLWMKIAHKKKTVQEIKENNTFCETTKKWNEMKNCDIDKCDINGKMLGEFKSFGFALLV